MSAEILDTFPGDLLARFRGVVTEAHVTPSRRIKLRIADPEGGGWSLVSWHADFAEDDDSEGMTGKTISGLAVTSTADTLMVDFSDGSFFTVTPIADEADDATENWEIFTPEGLVLAFGPRGRWLLGRADDPDYRVGHTTAPLVDVPLLEGAITGGDRLR